MKSLNYRFILDDVGGKRTEQRPEDFMDEEDMSEFGIAPQQLIATEDFRMCVRS